jgi:hypothetical protein
MKRARDNIDDTQCTPLPSPLWLMPDVLYRHVAQFFGPSFWDHWHFSRVNRALWHHYHAYDESMQILERYFFSRWARERDVQQHRRNNVFRTANLRCLVWLWEHESKWRLKDELAIGYMEMGAMRGNLDTIYHFGRYITDTDRHSRIEVRSLEHMVRAGHDNAACRFWTKIQQKVVFDHDRVLVFRTAASHVHRAPNFFMRIQETCLESVKRRVNPGYQDRGHILIMSAIISLLGEDRKNGFNHAAFSYFWDCAPHLREFIVHELCFISCTSAIAAPLPYGMWSTIIAQLPYVLTKYGCSAGFPMEITGPLSVQWTFPLRGTTRPEFVIRCDAVKVNEAFQEIDCRIGFRCKDRHEEMNLVFTLPVAMTPFKIPTKE